MGVARVLKARSETVRISVLEPASSPVITEGKAGTHHIEGIGVGFVPPFLDQNLYDEARGVPEEDARAMCRRLAREEGRDCQLVCGAALG